MDIYLYIMDLNNKVKMLKNTNSVKDNIAILKDINLLLNNVTELVALNKNKVSNISFIINSNESDLSDELKEIQKLLLFKMNDLISDFNEQCKIDKKNYLKKYLSIIRKKSSKNNLLKKDLFSDVYCDDGISQFYVDNLLELFYEIISIYPTHFFNNINNVNLVIKNDDGFSYSDCKNNLIYLAKDDSKNILVLLSELVHEMTHMIEFYNKDINKMARNYIKERSSGIQDSIKNLSLKYNKLYNEEIGEEIVYDIKSEDFYSGKIYANKMTELISNGIEYYLNNHICFMFLDPDYAEFLLNVFESSEALDAQI